jgi:hypothetical protein
MATYRCLNCQDERWVCAAHPHVPWGEGKGCNCGAEGAPCPACNTERPPADPAWSEILARAEGRY